MIDTDIWHLFLGPLWGMRMMMIGRGSSTGHWLAFIHTRRARQDMSAWLGHVLCWTLPHLNRSNKDSRSRLVVCVYVCVFVPFEKAHKGNDYRLRRYWLTLIGQESMMRESEAYSFSGSLNESRKVPMWTNTQEPGQMKGKCVKLAAWRGQ